jgi:hypothetical protein
MPQSQVRLQEFRVETRGVRRVIVTLPPPIPAVARLAKEPTNGVIMQALHGIEIIGSYLHK